MTLSKFTLANQTKFYLPGTNERFEHLATIMYFLREFIYFMDLQTGQTYIEEITGGNLKWIEDTQLWADIAAFIAEKGINTIQRSI